MQAFFAVAILVLSTPFLTNPNLSTDSAMLEQLPEITETPLVLPQKIDVTTESKFSEETTEMVEELDFETIFEENPEEEVGFQEVKTEGKVGHETTVIKTTYWEGEELEQEIIETKVEDPVDEVVIKGTKVVIRDIETEDLGNLEYKEKLTVWATSYDGNCYGCLGRTATGKRVTHGICATDPTVIPLGTAFYVPGYGMCSAQDTGGAIKGNTIDVGFEDVHQGWWSARFTDTFIFHYAKNLFST